MNPKNTSQAAGVAIELTQCSKTFGNANATNAGQVVLQPLDLKIHAGETLVLLGPSGCGKTTTLRIIAGLESPDAGGVVRFGNDDVTALPIEQRNVGMVFQSYALFPNMSVRGNIEYGLKIRCYSSADRSQRSSEMLEMMELGALADRRIDQLSGGQRQRVALARAIAPRPRVLLLDEPLTALDARLRDTLRIEISRLLRSLGITAVYVTHDQAEAFVLGDRVAVMDNGRLAQIGTPQEIYFSPATTFVAGFIGTTNSAEIAGQTRLFRPEEVRLWPAGSAPAPQGEAAQLNGRISSCVFLGDHVRVIVDVGQSRPVVAKLPPRSLVTLGDAVTLAIELGGVESAPA